MCAANRTRRTQVPTYGNVGVGVTPRFSEGSVVEGGIVWDDEQIQMMMRKEGVMLDV
jgi:hypothetical protein